MFTEFWLPLLVKALATASLVVAASVLSERLGPIWGALITSLPISVGPAYVFLALKHDNGFVAASALSSCAANGATGLFLITYGLRAAKAPVWNSLGLAIGIWFTASLAIQAVDWTPLTASAMNIAVYGAGFVLLPSDRTATARKSQLRKGRWFELPLRAIAVAAFVVTVVLASSALGSKATGIATVFPLSFTCLLAILRARLGGSATALLASTALRSMLGFGAALLVLHLTIQPLGAAAGLSLALMVSVCWSAGLLVQRAQAGARRRPMEV
ncbi:hypothetical protein ACFPL7_20645 [Dongia soli]|uniref:Uncharacterized protein n=1 Tax=Dongia soli TaxID=600628 RepID=A0ABU5E6U7_9PROT|nr:hypothetical protein [Dongia soli]MDY0882001.1 hypothetical protein [Dongia soli]